ncbi:MAG: hypothetical protein AXA67_05875 [Methylothermaceae bacteria B42]|nr:MAG: hypothetical protein AXA67_05875 [Methylothermaceae bacteria B42]HHJ38670.1 hypothetical protein [Methylothermaceae bacterium]
MPVAYSYCIKKRFWFQMWSLIGMFLAVPAAAEFSATLNGTTNYVYRGYSKSDDHPVAQINLDYEHEKSGLYLGVWTSMVDFGEDEDEFDDPTRVEIIPYIGWSYPLFDDWRFETFATRYIYAGKIFGHSADYNEFLWRLHFQDLVTAQIAWAPNYFSHGQSVLDYEVSMRYPITHAVEISGTLGFNQARDVLEYDYLYWDAGFSWFFKYLALDFRYVQSAYPTPEAKKIPWPYDPHKLDPTFVFSISVGF